MSDDELLITSRARRSNAGSRLKQLIELEGDSTNNQVSRFVDEDDENVNLLFQEDADDQEFMESEEEEDEEEDDEQEEESTAGKDADKATDANEDEEVDETEQKDELDESDSEAPPVDSDDVLSDSDISLSDSDESEGEKELERAEKQKKRKQKQQSKLIPKIKKFKPADSKPKAPKPKKMVTSEALLSAKRSSSRASVRESKEALVKKLKEDEKRRAALTPVVREKVKEMTQEEKLAEAVETEKANVLSLELFQQQEVVKKERQKLMFQQKRPRLVNVVRYSTKQEFITPNEEIDYARKVYHAVTGKYKKRAIKRLLQMVDFDLSRYPGQIDRLLPYFQEEERKKAEIEKQLEDAKKNGDAAEPVIPDQSNDELVQEQEKHEPETVNGTKETETETEPSAEPNGQPETPAGVEEGSSEKSEEKPDGEPEELEAKPEDKAVDTESKEDTPSSSSEQKRKKVSFVNGVKEPEPEPEPEPETQTSEQPIESETTQTEETEPIEEEPEEEKETFEGPPQRVTRNNIFLIDFQVDQLPLDENKIKAVIFGEQSLLPAPRRLGNMKTILRIGRSNNPYAKAKVEKDEIFLPAVDLTEDNPMFEELNRLPKLGIRQEIIEEVVKEDDNDAAIILNTEAPVGLYLPNGNKKLCLITGEEVRYFDPSLGVPYSDVETFKFLKQMEMGKIPWLSFDSTYNDTGATELYLGSRDGSTRSARGVPDGFDG